MKNIQTAMKNLNKAAGATRVSGGYGAAVTLQKMNSKLKHLEYIEGLGPVNEKRERRIQDRATKLRVEIKDFANKINKAYVGTGK